MKALVSMGPVLKGNRMRFLRIAASVFGLGIWSLGVSLHAEPIIEETFTGYLDNVLISASPAGPAIGLTGDWRLPSDSDFFVNKTRDDNNAGAGKAVYERPSGDNGSRTATRSTSTVFLPLTACAQVSQSEPLSSD